jgi:hypothetical protein
MWILWKIPIPTEAEHRSFLDPLKHVEQPCFPVSRFCHAHQQAVIVRFVFNDIPAQIQDGNIQQPRMEQVKDIENPPSSSVPIGERVNRFKLIVCDRHLDERINVIIAQKE